jgi:hypothetical protein
MCFSGMIGPTASQASPEQGDLFEERGTWPETEVPQQGMGDVNLESLSDKDLDLSRFNSGPLRAI